MMTSSKRGRRVAVRVLPPLLALGVAAAAAKPATS